MSGTMSAQVARIEAENDRLHRRMGFWRERAGELKELLSAVLEVEEASEVPRWSSELTEQVREMSGTNDSLPPDQEEMEKWLDTRPPKVRRMAKKFPPGTKVQHQGDMYYVVGYVEELSGDCDVGVKLSSFDPIHEYELATNDENTIDVYPVISEEE